MRTILFLECMDLNPALFISLMMPHRIVNKEPVFHHAIYRVSLGLKSFKESRYQCDDRHNERQLRTNAHKNRAKGGHS